MCKDEKMNKWWMNEWSNHELVDCRLYRIGQFEIIPTDGVFWNQAWKVVNMYN